MDEQSQLRHALEDDPARKTRQPLRVPVSTHVLIAEYENEETLGAIGARHGLSRGGVKKRLVNAGVSIRPQTETKRRIGPDNGRWLENPTVNAGRIRARFLLTEAEPCNRCGSEQYPHRHHIDHDPTNSAPENLEWLCAGCHKRHHVAARKAAANVG